MRFVSRLCALGATLGAALTMVGPGSAIGAADPAQIEKLCDPATTYQLVYDKQHDTYWIDEPFTCTARTSP